VVSLWLPCGTKLKAQVHNKKQHENIRIGEKGQTEGEDNYQPLQLLFTVVDTSKYSFLIAVDIIEKLPEEYVLLRHLADRCNSYNGE
jgi:hypothetical protein